MVFFNNTIIIKEKNHFQQSFPTRQIQHIHVYVPSSVKSTNHFVLPFIYSQEKPNVQLLMIF